MFTIDGKRIHEFASVPHLGRDDETGKLDGYQRPEVRAHIKNIREYIESGNRPILPNAIVVAFVGDKGPKFVPAVDGADVGTLELKEDPKLAEIVDGQQRCAAIRDADVETFPVCVVGFIAEDEEMRREQFMRVNSSRPLPRQFIMELLPGVGQAITSELEKRRVPALLIDHLNNSPDSPLRGFIKTASHKGEIPGTVFADGLTASLKSGVLYNFRNEDGSSDTDGMITVVSNFWKAVAQVFNKAWNADRKDSRITYAGPVGALMGLMDEMSGELSAKKLTISHFRRELELIAPVCHWTAADGDWNFGPDGTRPWDGIENGTKGISFLRDFLVKAYKKAKVQAAESSAA